MKVTKEQLLEAAYSADYLQMMKTLWWDSDDSKDHRVPEHILNKLFMLTKDERDRAIERMKERCVEAVEKRLADVDCSCKTHDCTACNERSFCRQKAIVAIKNLEVTNCSSVRDAGSSWDIRSNQ